MKGPYQRLKYSMLRIWECPECNRRERTNGTHTTNVCDCTFGETKKMQSMRLVEDDIRLSGIANPPVVAVSGSDTPNNDSGGQNDG